MDEIINQGWPVLAVLGLIAILWGLGLCLQIIIKISLLIIVGLVELIIRTLK